MPADKDLNYSVSVMDLKTGFFQADTMQKYILREDIFKKGILLLSKGKKLTLDIAEKLLNFGIDEVKVYYNEKDYEEEEYSIVEELKKNFVRNLKIVIVDNDFKSIGFLAKILVKFGFSEKNIIAVSKSYLESAGVSLKFQPDYLFADADLYYRCEMIFDIKKCKRIFTASGKAVKVNNPLAIRLPKPLKTKDIEEKLLYWTDKDFHNLLRNDAPNELSNENPSKLWEPLFSQ